MDESIVMDCYFAKATTTVDGGWRISFDLHQSQSLNISQLSQLMGQPLAIVVMTEEQLKQRKENQS